MNYFDLPYTTIMYNTTHNNIDRIQQQNERQKKKLDLSFYNNTECNMSGTVHRFGPFYVSQNAKKSLIHPVIFILIKANKEYYTKREGLNCFELRYTISGSGKLTYQNKTYQLNPGDGFLIDNRIYHYYRAEEQGWTSTVFHLNGKLVQSIYTQFTKNGNYVFHKENCPSFELYQHEIIRTLKSISPYREYKASCLADLLLTEILTNTVHKNPASFDVPELIRKISSYIDKNYAEITSIDALCKSFYVSREYISRQFTKYIGLSPKEYLTHVRIHQAKVLLKSTTQPVSGIAYQVGFNDESYFIKVFKKLEHMTPLQYRKHSIF